jgi:hypothetical protein
MDTFVTPAFPGYTSGHSTFSRAAAEVLTRFTGSPYFPGGLGGYFFPANEFLKFERGPSGDVALQWATYYDAADQAGQSRIWGGIHILADDFGGRRMGATIGANAYDTARTYWMAPPTRIPTSTGGPSPTPTASPSPTGSGSTTVTPTPSGGAAGTATATPAPSPRVHLVLQNLPGALLSVTGTSARDVYAVGADANDGSGPLMLHYDGQVWHRLRTGARSGLWWISVTPVDGAFYLAGANGLVMRYTPSTGQFETQATPNDQVILFGIWGADASDVWAVGGDLSDQDAGGALWHYDGIRWSVDTSLAALRPAGVPTLYKVWGRSASDVYVSGRLGVVFHFDGSRWSEVAIDRGGIDPAQLPLFTIHGNATEVAASGGTLEGVILELVGDAFANRAPLGSSQFNGVFLAPDGSGAAVGIAGAVARREAGVWTLQDPAIRTDLDLHSAWIDPEGGVWAVGGELTSSLDRGIVAYGGEAAVGGTILDAAP